MYIDHRGEARRHRNEVDKQYRHARNDARRAERYYHQAGEHMKMARWLTGRPELWDGGLNPARSEEAARTWTRLGDLYLQTSFSATERARFYAGLQRRAEALADASDARLAAYEAELAGRGAELWRCACRTR
jgi:hypothetical protein